MGLAQKQPIPPEPRLVGTVIPVGALRGEQSLGVGEFADLPAFGELCKHMGLALIQLLPVNDTGYDSSPYCALSSCALHPLYLRIQDLPEAAKDQKFIEKVEAQLDVFRDEPRFPYYRILSVKMELLRSLYEAHGPAIAEKARPGGPLATWIHENSWVKEYAVYRRLKEANGEKSWKDWERYKTVTQEDIQDLWKDSALWSQHLFWVWVQEALDIQFRKAATALQALGLILEGDIPILMNEDSCDVWAHSEYFHLDLAAGAPPDMYSPMGQNWGFPIYNWQAQAKDDYGWWKNRLKVAEKYYRAYRIDHVLGFFRIWASRREDISAILGRFVPAAPLTSRDLSGIGFDSGRIRWISLPHIPAEEVWNSLRHAGLRDSVLEAEAGRVFSLALDRIGDEHLWLFKETIRGEKDIEALEVHPAAKAYLLAAWDNRIFLEYAKGKYSPVWYYRNSRAYASLSWEERQRLDALVEQNQRDSEQTWERQGKKLLAMLRESSIMLPCAEDLGAVPECVPRVLTKLKILGLRVIRWSRNWDEPGEPYLPLAEYPSLSVCTPAVHDSSTLREWWETEADQQQFAAFIGAEGDFPAIYNPATAKIILSKIASAASRFRVFQIQDLLHLSPRWYAPDPARERINVPGKVDEFNWTYRLPATIPEIALDHTLVRSVRELSTIAPEGKNDKTKGKNQ
ncbi:MAG: 4-alpha-glucanotransferase [Spirochaetaceae bacterium]|jgi:4-alpha-glucanotransferase|nr:4-alpha-glucanotransferase [Spirochaetaceae bacterium]